MFDYVQFCERTYLGLYYASSCGKVKPSYELRHLYIKDGLLRDSSLNCWKWHGALTPRGATVVRRKVFEQIILHQGP